MPKHNSRETVYEVKFKRLASEPSIDVVLKRPYSDEIEDYQEYKRLHQVERERQEDVGKVRQPVGMPAVTVSQDGNDDRDGGGRRFAALGPFGRVDSMQGADSSNT